MKSCPYFDNCNAVKCLLDELMHKRVKLPEDKEKCRLSRGKRMRMGRDMKTRGLSPYEIAALIRTYGTLERGIKAVLNKNFNRKKRRKYLNDKPYNIGRR